MVIIGEQGTARQDSAKQGAERKAPSKLIIILRAKNHRWKLDEVRGFRGDESPDDKGFPLYYYKKGAEYYRCPKDIINFFDPDDPFGASGENTEQAETCKGSEAVEFRINSSPHSPFTGYMYRLRHDEGIKSNVQFYGDGEDGHSWIRHWRGVYELMEQRTHTTED